MTDTPPYTAQPSQTWRKPHPLALKAGLLFILGLLLLIPVQSIRELIAERQSRQEGVIAEIAQAWGPPQEILGPFLEVPYQLNGIAGNGALKFLPLELQVIANLDPKRKSRGFYDVPVYRAAIEITATFGPLDLNGLGIAPETLQLEKAALVFLVGSSQGLSGDLVGVLSNGRQVSFEASANQSGMIALKAPFALSSFSSPPSVKLALTLNGTSRFSFAPAARDLDLSVTSPWPHPSFAGWSLPGESQIDDRGFSATWHLNNSEANVASAWAGVNQESDYQIKKLRDQIASVRLIEPVDGYLMSERAIKYAPFVLLLVFAAVFLFETVGKTPLHPVQYALLGCDMAIFFLQLLSLSEAIGFTPAYLAAAGMTALLAALYLYWSNKQKRQALGLFATLTAIHGYLYVTLAAEDFALLSGSLALFLLLAAAMLATRKLRWFLSATSG